MSSDITDYKCPNCGGPLHFAPEIQKLKCDYCDSEFSEQEVSKDDDPKYNDVSFQTKASTWEKEEENGFVSYTCNNCGAELFADPINAVTQCPYCGNNIIHESKFTGKYKPNRVIPFHLNEEDAKKALFEFYKHKPFLPKSFKTKNLLQEIKGVYVPFFLYDGVVEGEFNAHASNEHSYREGDYIVTRTDHYALYRKGFMEFENVPTDASIAMKDEYMDAIEPFDYDLLEDFDSKYMAGYIADQFDVDQEENKDRALSRMKHSTQQSIMATCIGYTSVLPTRSVFYATQGEVEYVFIPVYLLTSKWKDQTYLFAINGTNGKVAGDLPSDGKTIALYGLGILLACFIVIGLITGYLQAYIGGM